MNVARTQQKKAYARWTRGMASHNTAERVVEQARLDTAQWAKAGDELYLIVEQDYAQKASKR